MPARKRVAPTVRVQLEAGQALGAYGINLMAFIGAYNRASAAQQGMVVPVAKLERAQLREIARAKLQDLNTGSVDAAERIVAGTASSMGIEVVEA